MLLNEEIILYVLLAGVLIDKYAGWALLITYCISKLIGG